MMTRILTILVGVALGAALSNNDGKLSRVPLDLTPEGHPQPSWWLAKTSERSEDWKKEQLSLEYATVVVHKLVDGVPLSDSPPVTVTKVDDKGHFSLPDDLDGEYLLKVDHRAFQYPLVLVAAEGAGKEYTYTVVDSKFGIRHIVRRLPNLTLRPEGLQAPYPPPKPINIFVYLKNPMVIMILISLFASFVMPRLVNQEEMQAAAGEVPQLSTAFTNRVKDLKAN